MKSLILALLAIPVAVHAGNITVKGSDTMVILGQKWAEVYMKSHAGSTVQVTGGGSGTGIAALLNGSTDICNASRPMKPAEVADFVKKNKTRPHEDKMWLDALSGYGGIAYGEGVKHIKVSKTDGGTAIEPKEETVLDSTYPITRYLFNYVAPAKDTGAIADYIAWCTSDAGQAVVKEVGYFPLPKN